MSETKTKKSKEQIIEILTAVFLGITALATAWASWIGSLHGGNQSTNYTTSNNLSAEGNSMYNEASQSLMQDIYFGMILQAYVLITHLHRKRAILMRQTAFNGSLTSF